MNAFLLSMLGLIVRRLVDANLFGHMQALVEAQFMSDLPGDQKKAIVMKRLAEARGDLGAALLSTPKFLINFALEAAVVLVANKFDRK